MYSNDPKTLGLALLLGIIPAFFWLWFWLKEDNQKPEPTGLIAAIFIIGMVSIALVIPLERLIERYITTPYLQTIFWAGAEEIIKYLVVVVVLFKTNRTDEPIDWPIFLITAALGFAAIENALYILKPLSLNQTIVGILTGHLRFLGSTLLHAVSTGIVGISLGLSFFMNKYIKKVYLFIGLALAIALHSTFNFFIMNNSGNDFLKVLGFLWVVTIIIMLLFEKLRRMSV